VSAEVWEVLRRRSDFLRVQKDGRRFKAPRLAVLVTPGEGTTRVGFTVSRKVGNAVIRNRVRRRLKELVRREQLVSGFDHVIIAYTPAAGATFQELAQDIGWTLRQAREWASRRTSSSP
jgi:ribonuclease P protein component